MREEVEFAPDEAPLVLPAWSPVAGRVVAFVLQVAVLVLIVAGAWQLIANGL